MAGRERSRSQFDSGGSFFAVPGALMSYGASRPTSDTISLGWLHFNTGTSELEFWDGTTWQSTAGGGGGDVTGPGSSTDNAAARFDGTTGKVIQNSAVTIDDSGNIATAGTVDGRDVSTDGTKLDGIESGAEVNDIATIANVGAKTGEIYKGLSGTEAQLGTLQGAAGIKITNFSTYVTIGITTAGINVDKLTASGTFSMLTTTGASAAWTNATSGYSVVGRANGMAGFSELAAGSANSVLLRGTASVGDLDFRGMKRLVESMIDGTAISGSTFPSTGGAPLSGWPFYKSGDEELSVYNGAWSVWVGVDGFTITAIGDAGQSSGFLNLDSGGLAFASGAASIGWVAPYACRPVWMTAHTPEKPSTAVTIQVYKDDGGTGSTAISNATISFSSGSGKESVTADLATGTIPTIIESGREIYINQNTAQADGSYRPLVMVHFRRCAS